MREGLLVIPQADNSGTPLNGVLASAQTFLANTFGGCTTREARGAWVSPSGELFNEPVWEVVAAYEPSPEHDRTLRNLAGYVGKVGKQQAVYLRYASGDVEILDTSNELKEAA